MVFDLWPCGHKSQNFGFFRILVFFKVYFDHVPDCILAWKIFTIFFDPCRINKKIFEPIGRYWRRQTICALDVKLVRPTLHKTQFFLRHPVAVRKCSTLKIDFSANFNMIFFGGGSVNTPKIGKRKNNVTNINLRECKTQKNMRGVFVMDKTGLKFSLF